MSKECVELSDIIIDEYDESEPAFYESSIGNIPGFKNFDDDIVREKGKIVEVKYHLKYNPKKTEREKICNRYSKDGIAKILYSIELAKQRKNK